MAVDFRPTEQCWRADRAWRADRPRDGGPEDQDIPTVVQGAGERGKGPGRPSPNPAARLDERPAGGCRLAVFA